MKTKTPRLPRQRRQTTNRLLTLHEPSAAKDRSLRLKVIVVPVDFSVESKKALRYASKLAAQFGSVLRLVHVVEPAPFLNDVPNVIITRSEAEVSKESLNKLQSLAQEEIEELIPVQTEVRVGKPYHEIVSAAKVLGADLIVIATHGYTGLKHALLGSTAERVVRHAKCPVLVVRESERDFA